MMDAVVLYHCGPNTGFMSSLTDFLKKIYLAVHTYLLYYYYYFIKFSLKLYSI